MCTSFLAHLCRPPATTVLSPGSGDGSFLSLEDMIHDNHLGILHCSSPQDSVPWDSFKQIPEQASVCSPGVQGCGLQDSCPVHPLRLILNSTIAWPLQTRLLTTFTSLTNSYLFVSTRPSRVSPVIGPLLSCVKTLSSVLFRNYVACLSPAVVFLQQILGLFKSPVRTGICKREAFSSCLKVSTTLS